MEKVIMVHYLLPVYREKDIAHELYKKKVQEEYPEFKHLFFPSTVKEGIEIIRYEEPIILFPDEYCGTFFFNRESCLHLLVHLL